MPRRRVGDGERADVRPADAHERQRERDGQRRGRTRPSLEDSGHPARCAPHEERRHHRGSAGKRHRQVCETGRCDRRRAAGHQPTGDDGQHDHQCREMPGRGDLLAASAQPEDGARDHARASHRVEEAGRARRSGAMPRDAEHSARAGAHGDLRSDDRDRRRRNGEGRVRLGQAGVRRRGWQRDGRDRRDGRCCRRRKELADQ